MPVTIAYPTSPMRRVTQSLINRRVAQGHHCHSSDIVSAIDDVGAEHVISKGEDLLSDISEDIVAGLETACRRCRIELRIEWVAVLQGDDRECAVCMHGVSCRVVNDRGNLRTRDVADRFHTSGKSQVTNYLRALFVDVWCDVMHEALV